MAQTFRDFEFVIVNDGSTDHSLQLLRAYEAHDARITVINQGNTGLTVALQRGVEASSGEYIARMDADDVSMPTRFEKQMALLRSDASLAMVSWQLEHFIKAGATKVVQRLGFDPRLASLFACFHNPIAGHGQVLYRRAAYEAAGGYDPDYNLAEDYDLWTRILRQGKLGVVPEVLYRYRVSDDSVTARNKSAQEAVTRRIITRECARLIGREISDDTAQAMLEFWWARKPERTPLGTVPKLNSAMSKVFDSYFEQNPSIGTAKAEAARVLAKTWRWRGAKVQASEVARRALYLTYAGLWRLKA